MNDINTQDTFTKITRNIFGKLIILLIKAFVLYYLWNNIIAIELQLKLISFGLSFAILFITNYLLFRIPDSLINTINRIKYFTSSTSNSLEAIKNFMNSVSYIKEETTIEKEGIELDNNKLNK